VFVNIGRHREKISLDLSSGLIGRPFIYLFIILMMMIFLSRFQLLNLILRWIFIGDLVAIA